MCAGALGACHEQCRVADCKCTTIRLTRWLALPVTNSAPYFLKVADVCPISGFEARVARSHRWTFSHVTCGAQVQHDCVQLHKMWRSVGKNMQQFKKLYGDSLAGPLLIVWDRVFVFFGAPASYVNTRAPRNCSWHKQVDTLVRWLAEFLAQAKERDCNTNLRHRRRHGLWTLPVLLMLVAFPCDWETFVFGEVIWFSAGLHHRGHKTMATC